MPSMFLRPIDVIPPVVMSKPVAMINCAVLQLDAFGGEARNGVVLDIDDVYIGLVELLVVAVFEAGALDAKGVRWL
jgi:hypothetical protein